MSGLSAFQAVDAIMATWTETVRFNPGDEVIPPAPEPDRSSEYVAWDLEEAGSEWTDMARGTRHDGMVKVGIWVEKNAGDARIQELRDALDALFPVLSGSLTFYPSQLSDASEEGGWRGREWQKPYVRLEAGS